jgi:adenylate cyclase
MERRIVAILAADMVGYSRLIELDEKGTLERQKRHMIELIRPCIENHNGTIVKLTGDGLIAEFGSVIQAVQCAVEVQKEMPVREEDQPDGVRIRYRTAINLGDVVFDDGDIYGDGVNIAARLEALAEPGGIVVSGSAYDLLKKNVDVKYVPIGEKRLKNISTPVRVYQVVARDTAVKTKSRNLRPVAIALAMAVLLAGVIWFSSGLRWGGETVVETGKPSLAVLPLDNLSGDPSQDWFANGLSDDLTTDLSRHPGLFVIARNSAFIAAEKSDDPVLAARDLKVSYVIEGSVRRVGDTLRINVQMIESKTGGHVWAERFDGTPEDVLAFMDSVPGSVLSVLGVEETDSFDLAGETDNPQAFDAYLEGWERYLTFTPEGMKMALTLFERAIELDPDYARAHAALGATLFKGWEKWWHSELGYSQMDRRFMLEDAQAQVDVAMKAPNGLAHQLQADLHRINGNLDKMIESADAAVQTDPGDPNSYVVRSLARMLNGNAEQALVDIDRAMELEPHYPPQFLARKGMILFDLKRYDEAIAALERALERNPVDSASNHWLAAAYAQSGQLEKAVAAGLAYADRISIDGLKLYAPYRYESDWEHLAEGLRLAGYR